MFSKLKLVSLFVLAAVFGQGCKNELDTNSDWKEILVTYCLLNSSDTIQYAKVGRAYLNYDKSALEIAKISDSLYFDSIKVELVESPGGKIILMNKDLSKVNEKDSGIFAESPNILYSTKEKIDHTKTYKIRVTNLRSGNTTEANTNIVYPLNLANSIPHTASTSMVPLDTGKSTTISFTAALNGEIYDCNIRFYWDEYDAATNAFIGTKYIDWHVLNHIEVTTSSRYDIKLQGNDFFNLLADNIPENQNIYRKAKYVDLLYWGANREFLNYYNVNKPSIGIVQKKPDYTNFSNDNYGIFASRSFNTIRQLQLATTTSSRLASLPHLKRLKFQ